MDALELDELLVISQYQILREQGHGDLEVSVKDGRIIKIWRTDKLDIESALKHPNVNSTLRGI